LKTRKLIDQLTEIFPDAFREFEAVL
jgi:hypothetical protein